jgi:Icc-related predicted phosphoesterase
LKLFGKKGRGDGLTLYYASDAHGSDLCWRKFLNAGPFYDVDALIMGGDLTGKGLVPVVGNGNGYTARLIGEERRATTEEELEQLEAAIRRNGFYPKRMSSEELEAMRGDAAVREEVFARAMQEELQRWIALAEERLAMSGLRAYVMAGNDDPWEVDQVLEGSDAVVACDARIVRVGGHEMVSFGWSNPTPWNSPRELPEDELYRRVKELTDALESPSSAILNLHVPPYGSGLDTAMELDDELRPVIKGGRPHEMPVGSTAVRQLIEEVQPALSLHGHIHESRGITRVGRTVAINPGSDYASGRIDGVVVELGPDGVRRQQLVSG